MARALMVLALLTAVAHADVISDEEYRCQNKAGGDVCEGGACVMDICSRARPGPDGKPVTISWPCVMCRAGAPDAGDTIRTVIGLVVAAAMIGGGVVLARKRMKANA